MSLRLPVIPLLLASSVLAGSAVFSCSSSDTGGTAGNDAGGTEAGGSDATIDEDGSVVPDEDASTKDAPADAPKDANVRDGNGPGAADAICTFNWDCQSALRCECTEELGCACKPGTRGTGKNGIDPCTSGNECASSVCIEGPPGTGNFCSDECGSSADCVGQLPVCQTIAFVGTVCVRTPPK